MHFADAIVLNAKFLLRAMLWSLVAAALLGAAAALFGTSDVVWQAVATLILTAVSSAMLLFVSRRLGEHHLAQLLATALIYLEFIICLTLIWTANKPSFFDQYGIRLLALASSLAGAGAPTVIYLLLIDHPLTRIAARTGPALWLAVFLIWMVAVIIGPDSTPAENWWAYGFYLAGLGFLACTCLVGFGMDRRHWRWFGVIAATAAYIFAVRQIASSLDKPQPLTGLVSLAVVFAIANLLRCAPLRPSQLWLAYASIAAASLAALLINFTIVDHYRNGASGFMDSSYDRPAAALSILATCGILGVVIMVFINRWTAPPPRDAAELIKDLKATILCPVCRHKQSFGKDGGVCAGCGLTIKVSVEEPRCPACGYSLLMNKSDRCPECGAPMPRQPLV